LADRPAGAFPGPRSSTCPSGSKSRNLRGKVPRGGEPSAFQRRLIDMCAATQQRTEQTFAVERSASRGSVQVWHIRSARVAALASDLFSALALLVLARTAFEHRSEQQTPT